MQRGFIKEGLWSLWSKAQGGGIVMITLVETGSPTEEEVAVEVWTGMTVIGTVEGTETTVVGAGVAVIVLITAEAVAEIAMMMKGAAVVDQLKVLLLDEVLVHVEACHLAGVFHLVGVLCLVVHLVQEVGAQIGAASMDVL